MSEEDEESPLDIEAEETSIPFKPLEAGFMIPEEMKQKFIISYFQEILDNFEEEDNERWEVTVYPTINSLYTGLRRKIQFINTTVEAFDEGGIEATELGIEDFASDIDEEFFENILTRVVISDDVLTFYVVAQDAIERFSMKLLHDSLVVEPYDNSRETTKMLDRYMSQPQRQRFLKRFGLMDAPVVDKMDRVRDNRNDLVHEPAMRDFYEFGDNIMPKVDEAIDILNEFHEIENGEPYWEEE